MWDVVLAWVMMLVVLGLVFWGIYALVNGATRRPGCGRYPDPEKGRAQSGRSGPVDPVLTLRERYARGDIDVVEFEQRLEDLLRTETGHSGALYIAQGEPTNGSPNSRESRTRPASSLGQP
jgi:uncharacterized membrane protein